MADDVVVKLPPETVKKIQVLRQLTGAASNSLVNDIVKMVDQAIGFRIVEALGITVAPATKAPRHADLTSVGTTSDAPALKERMSTGHPSEIADGLGDDDPDQEEAIREAIAENELKSKVTDADLERDMEVKDPEVEAKGLPTFRERYIEKPESLFDVDFPKSPDEEPTQRARRARVTPLTEAPGDAS